MVKSYIHFLLYISRYLYKPEFMLCFVAHQKNNRIYDYLFNYWNNSDSLFYLF